MPSSSSRKIAAANGFGRSSLTVVEAWVIYRVGYPVPPDMHLPSSGGWRMSVNGVGVPPPPPGTELWRDAIRAWLARLTAEEWADPTWVATRNDAWWVDYFQAQHDVEMNIPAGLIFRGVPRRTLEHVGGGIQNGASRLEMPSLPPPSPTPTARWQPRRTYSSSSNSSSSGPARSTPSSLHHAAPYTVPKRDVKEELKFATPPVIPRRGGNNVSVISQV
jgi:hypothetical protein